MIKNNQVESTLENIKSYFETYIKTYRPYKDNQVYEAILDTLIENYYKELYIDVPNGLLNVVVKNIIYPKTNIDYFLIETGLPEELIDRLSLTEKWIFFQIFSDFMKYKSTLHFFQLIGNVASTSFPEKFNIYELWIDKDAGSNKWILRPILVYKNNVTDLRTEPLLYSNVYNKVPNLLISETQLDIWLSNNQLILPFKSNLILLDQHEITDAFQINGLIRASFLKKFGDRLQINLYFTDGNYTIPLEMVDKLWYYLIFRYYNFEQFEKDFGRIILFSRQNHDVPDISQIESITQQFLSIDSWDDYNSFYEQYFKPFKVEYSQSAVTQYTLYDDLHIEQPDLMEYIDNRINNSMDLQLEAARILDEIYGSLLLSVINYSNENYYQQYLPVYASLLSKIFVGVDDITNPRTFTSKIILNMKPFHTDVVLDISRAVRIQDKEFFKNIVSFAMYVNSASVLSISAFEFLTHFKLNVVRSFPIISFVDNIHTNTSEDPVEILVEMIWMSIIKKIASINVVSDCNYEKNIKMSLSDSKTLISIFKSQQIQNLEENYDISFKESLLRLLFKQAFTFSTISDESDSQNVILPMSNDENILSIFKSQQIQNLEENYDILKEIIWRIFFFRFTVETISQVFSVNSILPYNNPFEIISIPSSIFVNNVFQNSVDINDSNFSITIN
jgi:hypothetical protein